MAVRWRAGLLGCSFTNYAKKRGKVPSFLMQTIKLFFVMRRVVHRTIKSDFMTFHEKRQGFIRSPYN